MTSQPNPFASHWLIRDIVVGSHLEAVGSGGFLFIGDSIVEGFYWNRIGNLPVLNAGYSGIWTEALEPKLPRLLKSAGPRLAALLVGTNDAKKDRTESDLDQVAEQFQGALRHFTAAGIPFIVITPPPVETGRRLTSFYSVEAMASLSRRIVQIAQGQAAAIIDMHRAFSNDDGGAKQGVTMDGIHLSAPGYRRLHDMLERTVAQLTAQGDKTV